MRKIIEKSIISPQKTLKFGPGTDDYPAEQRFARMLVTLNHILRSYGYGLPEPVRPLPPFTRYSHKYKYFGNNSKLIRETLKKRWWWSETHTMGEADFVWTQLKQTKIIFGVRLLPQEEM